MPLLEEALLRASGKGHTAVVELLLDKGAQIDVRALCSAARAGELEMVRLLLEKGVDPNGATGSPSPLCFALRFDRIEMVKLLLGGGADINGEGKHGYDTALYVACCKGSTELVDLLL